MSKKILNGPSGLVLELDRSEWYPDDPGAGCPALVIYKGQTASLNCAIEEEQVWSDKIVKLTGKQVAWLMNKESEAWEWIRGND